MGRIKMTISVPEELAAYLRSTPSVSSTIAEAVTEYRSRALEAQLEVGYREDAEESERLAGEWAPADAGVSSE